MIRGWSRGLRGIAVLYALAFALVTAGFGAAVYFATTRVLAAQVDARLAAESREVQGEGFSPRVSDVARHIGQRQDHRSTGDLSYLLYDRAGRLLTGRLQMPTPKRGYSDVVFRDGADEFDRGRALATPIGDGSTLVVVADSEPVEAFDALLVKIFAVAFGAAILVGVLGGAGLSAVIARRVAGINKAAEAIIDGDLSQRMPVDQSGDAFDRQAVTLNHMLDRIAELMSNLRQVSNDVAHDLRTPLSRLRNRLELAARPCVAPDEVRASVEAAVVDVDELLELFAALLRISQVEAGERRAAFDWIDLGGLARDVVETFAPAVEDEGRRLVVKIDLPHVIHGDRELLTQLTVNLVENASRHTPRGTIVTVGVVDRNGSTILSVADDGLGIGDVAPSSLVRRFTRLDQSRSTVGHGLGLALVDAIARLHEASLTLHDNNPGLRVEVAFPRREGWLG